MRISNPDILKFGKQLFDQTMARDQAADDSNTNRGAVQINTVYDDFTASGNAQKPFLMATLNRNAGKPGVQRTVRVEEPSGQNPHYVLHYSEWNGSFQPGGFKQTAVPFKIDSSAGDWVIAP